MSKKLNKRKNCKMAFCNSSDKMSNKVFQIQNITKSNMASPAFDIFFLVSPSSASSPSSSSDFGSFFDSFFDSLVVEVVVVAVVVVVVVVVFFGVVVTGTGIVVSSKVNFSQLFT